MSDETRTATCNCPESGTSGSCPFHDSYTVAPAAERECPDCGDLIANAGALVNHRRFRHGITKAAAADGVPRTAAGLLLDHYRATMTLEQALARVARNIEVGRSGWADPELLAALEKVHAAAAETAQPSPGLDVEALREAFHTTHWCKDAGRGHAFAHDDEDEDGFRGRFLAEYARLRDGER